MSEAMSRGVILGHADLHEGPPVAIRKATDADLALVLANLRPQDAREAFAMFPGAAKDALALSCMAGWAWAIELHGRPIACFGYVKRSGHVVEGWSFGTKDMTRAIPAMSRFAREELPALWAAHDIHVVEVRALAEDSPSHAWLQSLGFVRKCTLEDQGAGGEAFNLYTWRRPFVGN